MILVIAFLSVIVFLVLGISIPLTFLGAAAIIVYCSGSDPMFLLSYGGSQINNVLLLTIPLFVLAGAVIDHGGIGRRLINSVEKLGFGKIKGGLGIVTAISSAVFGAISGSAGATIACIGSIMSPRLEENGYEVRRGKFISVRGKGQQRFIRLCSLGEGYTEEDIQAVISGTKRHHSRKKKPVILENQKFKLLVELDERIRAKGPGYQRWATTYNLKQMAKTRIFLKEQGIGSMEELREKADTAASEFDRIAKDLKAAEQRLVEIAALKKHIVNYAKTRDAYIAYRKARYSKTFFEAHREEITLHKAAKDAFEKMNVSKLPNVKALSEEYASTLTQKKALYAQYRLVREQMQEYQKALHNTEVFFELSEKEAACHQREHEKENSEEPNHS